MTIFNKYQIEISQFLFNREIDKITDEVTHNLSDLDHLKNYNDLCLRSEPIIDNIKDYKEKINQEIKKLFSKDIGKYEFLNNFNFPEKNVIDFNDYNEFLHNYVIDDQEYKIIYLNDIEYIRELFVGDSVKVQYLNIILSKMNQENLEFIIL
tara:strand:- start:101 stop:556 length:456 start_codon:yes stop_codon:yes gene_type:complete